MFLVLSRREKGANSSGAVNNERFGQRVRPTVFDVGFVMRTYTSRNKWRTHGIALSRCKRSPAVWFCLVALRLCYTCEYSMSSADSKNSIENGLPSGAHSRRRSIHLHRARGRMLSGEYGKMI